MTTWVVSGWADQVRISTEAQGNKMTLLFSAEGGDLADLAAQAGEYLRNNQTFDALILSAERDVIGAYRDALEPDMARFIVAEYAKADPARFTDRPTERYKKHANPKGRSKKWRQ